MAIATNFQSKNDVTVHIGTEITMGTATLTGGTWNTMPVTEYSITDVQASLGVAPQRTDSFGQQLSGAVHDRTAQMYEISLTMHGTAGAIDRMCLALFGDGDGANALLGSLPAVTTYDDAGANIVPVTILLDNAGADGTDLYYTSCMCTGIELGYGIGSDGGALKCTAKFVTGYEPTTGSLSATTPTDNAGTMFNIYDLTTHTLGGEDLLINDFNLSISRNVTRVSYDSTANYKPMGYVIGGYEVTGSLGCKRDSESEAVPTNTSTGIVLALSDGTFQVDAPKCMVESVSTDLADEGWKHSFSFRCFYDDAADTNPIVTITTA